MPAEYRVENKKLLHLGWQLREALKKSILTRVVLVGHIMCLQIKKHDQGGTRYDWVNHKEFVPPQSIQGDKNEITKTREGLTATPQLTDEDQAFIIFSALTYEDSKPIMAHFKEDYLIPDHRVLALDMTTGTDRNKKHRIIVKLQTSALCLEWKQFYSNRPFNGNNPTIELLKN